MPRVAVIGESTWTCPECGNEYGYNGTREEQTGPDEFQPYTHWFVIRVTSTSPVAVPGWAVVPGVDD